MLEQTVEKCASGLAGNRSHVEDYGSAPGRPSDIKGKIGVCCSVEIPEIRCGGAHGRGGLGVARGATPAFYHLYPSLLFFSVSLYP